MQARCEKLAVVERATMTPQVGDVVVRLEPHPVLPCGEELEVDSVSASGVVFAGRYYHMPGSIRVVPQTVPAPMPADGAGVWRKHTRSGMPEGMSKYTLVEVLLEGGLRQVGHDAADAEDWCWSLNAAYRITYYRIVK
jgi:hypothetical protein